MKFGGFYKPKVKSNNAGFWDLTDQMGESHMLQGSIVIWNSREKLFRTNNLWKTGIIDVKILRI